ncbi:MAG: hypothetical protein QM594_08385 [Niabella sp.]
MNFFCSALAPLLLLLISCLKPSGDIAPPEENPPAPKDSIIWGASFGAMQGESQAGSFERVKKAFGKYQVARIFCSGNPVWPAYIPVETVAHISFKMKPNEVLNGAKDAVLTQFFKGLAVTSTIYWTYFHEPEDNIHNGAFTAAEYRDAFDYIIDLQKKLGKPNLIPTLCLMAYSLDPASKRNWKDYLPKKVELISWDGYYRDVMGDDVSQVFGDVRKVMKTAGLPWAVAETGVNKMKNSGRVNEVMDIEKRKKLLTALAKDISSNDPLPVFVSYFDSAPPHDASYSSWRISDDPAMIAAWTAGQQK